MILTGRFIDADRALRAGLVSEIVDEDALLDRGLALADEMLATAPYGLRLSKQALNLNIDAPKSRRRDGDRGPPASHPFGDRRSSRSARRLPRKARSGLSRTLRLKALAK
jgi:ClpP class serine protease